MNGYVGGDQPIYELRCPIRHVVFLLLKMGYAGTLQEWKRLVAVMDLLKGERWGEVEDECLQGYWSLMWSVGWKDVCPEKKIIKERGKNKNKHYIFAMQSG
jgi:hypothetical protein